MGRSRWTDSSRNSITQAASFESGIEEAATWLVGSPRADWPSRRPRLPGGACGIKIDARLCYSLFNSSRDARHFPLVSYNGVCALFYGLGMFGIRVWLMDISYEVTCTRDPRCRIRNGMNNHFPIFIFEISAFDLGNAIVLVITVKFRCSLCYACCA